MSAPVGWKLGGWVDVRVIGVRTAVERGVLLVLFFLPTSVAKESIDGTEVLDVVAGGILWREGVCAEGASLLGEGGVK